MLSPSAPGTSARDAANLDLRTCDGQRIYGPHEGADLADHGIGFNSLSTRSARQSGASAHPMLMASLRGDVRGAGASREPQSWPISSWMGSITRLLVHRRVQAVPTFNKVNTFRPTRGVQRCRPITTLLIRSRRCTTPTAWIRSTWASSTGARPPIRRSWEPSTQGDESTARNPRNPLQPLQLGVRVRASAGVRGPSERSERGPRESLGGLGAQRPPAGWRVRSAS